MPEVEQPKEVKVEKVEEVSVEGKSEELEDEWVDILGSGDLKKKVRKKISCHLGYLLKEENHCSSCIRDMGSKISYLCILWMI